MTKLLFTYKDGDRYEPDDWSSDVQCISQSDQMWAVQRAIGSGELVVAEHWHYRGATAPDRKVFDDYEDFTDYLIGHAIAGDAIHVFSIPNALIKENQIAWGKCPDNDGLAPRKGSY